MLALKELVNLHLCSSRSNRSRSCGIAIRNFSKVMKVYTKTGDKGTSQLYSGERRSKNDPVFHAVGDTDELNGVIGVARTLCEQSCNGLAPRLEDIQSRLFDIGAAIATPLSSSSSQKVNRTAFHESHTLNLEKWIDEMSESLPPLREFILPSGGLSSSHLHVARSTCRRAERTLVPLIANGDVDHSIGIYLNRLSDFLFVAARFASKVENHPEKTWKKSTC